MNGTVAAHVLHMRMQLLASALHAEGRQATERRNYSKGVALRFAANRVRWELDLPPLNYDGSEAMPPS